MDAPHDTVYDRNFSKRHREGAEWNDGGSSCALHCAITATPTFDLIKNVSNPEIKYSKCDRRPCRSK